MQMREGQRNSTCTSSFHQSDDKPVIGATSSLIKHNPNGGVTWHRVHCQT